MEILGLKRHTVWLAEHNENWASIFEKRKDELELVLGNLVVDIQHIGSTSIKGIPAKPILDIAIGIENQSVIKECIIKLQRNDYVYRGDSGKEGGHLFVKHSMPNVRTEHIHFVEINDVQWDNYLKFRDYLNGHPNVAKEYGALKEKLAQKYPNDRRGYTAAKKDFIWKVLLKVVQRF